MLKYLIFTMSIFSTAVYAMGSGSPSGGSSSAPSEPSSSGEKVVTQTIVITKSGTYDFKKVLHVWKGKSWSCSGNNENGPQILRIEADNVTVKNFHFIGDGKSKGSNGLGDPVHITTCGRGQGNLCDRNGPRNVVIDGLKGHACEDLITIGTPGARNITIQNSYLKANPVKSGQDKTIQINFGQDIHIKNNVFTGGPRCVRFKPRTSGSVTGNKFYNCGAGVQATSNDADISPMQNGPTEVTVKNNQVMGSGTEVKTQGSQVQINR